MTNDKLQYFIDYWRDLTASDSIEMNSIHVIVYNPKDLFKEFIEEIRRNNLKNADNKKFFMEQVKVFAALKLDVLKFLKHTLALIQSQFDKKVENYDYLLHLLEMILLELDNFKLGKLCVEELSNVICDDVIILDSNIKNSIKVMMNLVYFELIHKGYSHKTIINILDNILSDYQEINGGVITTFPHQIKLEDYKQGDEPIKLFNDAVKFFIDNITLKNRILAVTQYLNKTTEKIYFIFQIHGIQGDDLELDYGGIKIYNPKYKQIMINDSFNHETFGNDDKSSTTYFNASVCVDSIDKESAKSEAINQLNKFLDILVCLYSDYKIPITINNYQYIIINEDGKELGFGRQSSSSILTHLESMKMPLLNDNLKNFINKVYGNHCMSILEKNIIESSRCHRFAIESSSFSEKILWHWVSLESIFVNHQIIINVVPKMIALHQLFTFAKKHYDKLNNSLGEEGVMRHYRRNLLLSKELVDKLLPDESGVIYLNNLVSNVDNICVEMSESDLFVEQLQNLKEIFSETDKCIKLLDDFERISREKMIYLYRVRNKIVHNANDTQGIFIEMYMKFAAEISTIAIQKFISIKENLNLSSSTEVVNNIIYSYEKFKLDLKSDGASILLK